MLVLDGPLYWVVIAPLLEQELRRIVAAEWRREFPHAVEPAPWAVLPAGSSSVIVGRSPGSEGAGDHLAAVSSRRAGLRPVHVLRLADDAEQVRTWVDGRPTDEPAPEPRELARSVGVRIPGPAPGRAAPLSVAVVSGAAPQAVRAALGPADGASWLRVRPCAAGVLVAAADGGPIGTQAWDLAEELPDAIIYFVQQSWSPDEFSVLVLQGQEQIGRFREPPLADDTGLLDGIAEARTADAILRRLGIPPEAIGRE